MKNIKKYILWFIFLSFGLTIDVFAVVNLEVVLPKDTEYPLVFDGYEGVSCIADSANLTEVYENNGNFIVRWKDSSKDSEVSGSEFISCSFEKSIDIPASASENEKKIIIEVKYGSEAMLHHYTVQMYNKYQESIDLFDHYGIQLFSDFKEIVQAKKITGDEVTDSGKDYVTIDCPVGSQDKCVISLKKELPNDDSMRFAVYEVDYKTNSGSIATSKIKVQLLSNMLVLAYPGQYGTCSFGSEWSYGSATKSYIQKLDGQEINLPSCTAENSANPFITFYGWVSYNDTDEDFPDMKNMDVCKDYVVTTSGTYTHETNKNVYFACYVSTGGIILSPSGGEVAMKDNYTYKDGLIFIKQEGMVELPEPTVPPLYNEYGTGVFEGWLNISTNKVHKAGEEVAANGDRYVASYSTGKTITGDSTSQKMVYVNETVNYRLGSTTIEDCSSTDESKLGAIMSGGECMLTGIADTGSEYVDLVVKTTGSTRSIKVRVVQKDGNYIGGVSIIDMEIPGNTAGFNEEGYFENVSGTNICNTYLVSNSGTNSGVIAKHEATGFGLSVTQYKAESRCSDNKTYLALCMDPGRPGPNSSDLYEIDKSFNPKNEFGRLVTHIVQKFIEEEKNDDTIYAANIALRIIEYYSTEELATDNNGGNTYLQNALAAYKAMGEHLNSVCSDISECDYDQIYSALAGAWTWSNDTIRSKVATFLTGFKNVDVEDTKIQNSSTRKSYFDENNQLLYKVEYNGELTFPIGMNVPAESIVADCGSVPGVSNCSVTGEFTSEQVYNYKFTYDIDLSNTGFYLPRTDDEVSPKIKIEVEEGLTNANVFVIKTLNDNKQRMVIFNTDPVALQVIMPIFLVCDIEKAPFKIGESGFRNDLFKAAGCCEFLTDETSTEFVTYCTADCLQTNFSMMCNPNYTVGNNSNVDVYSIDEAFKAGADGYKELNYACIVDVTGGTEAINNTNQYADATGNYYALMSYNDNQYCTVSCKENWNISTASFENFVGSKAINAGGHFIISHDIFIGGARTCVTTYIDYNLYQTELTNLSKDLTTAWSLQSEYSKVYSVLLASQGNSDAVEEKDYYTYERGNSYECDCNDYDEIDTKECTCYDWIQSEPKKCNVYKISTSTGDTSYQLASWGGQSATNGTGNISTGSLSGAAGGGSEIHTDWYEGKRPSKYSSSVGSNDGYCNDDEDFNYLMKVATYKGQNITSYIDDQRSIINEARAQIEDKAIDMTSCQNFELRNTSKESDNTFNYDNTTFNKKTFEGNPSISGFVATSGMAGVNTMFQPTGKYEYEEHEFMKELLSGNNNVIVTHDDLNNEKILAASKDPNTFNNDCIELDRKDENGKNIKLCKNKLTTLTYATSSPWDPSSSTGKTYGGDSGVEIGSVSLSQFQITLCNYSDGGSYEYSSHGDCQWNDGVVVYYPVNYIKQTLENSSFYKNKGIWATNDAADVKKYADSHEDAINKYSIDFGYVGVYGAPYNVFPVGLNTPKNIYQYSYEFSNIGSYSDGETGRIMGDSSVSLVAYNKHACFYEVYENLCMCCGDPIMWTTYYSSKLSDTENFLDNQGYDFDYSGKTLTDDYNGEQAVWSFVPSPVSLFDLTGGTGRELLGNWSSHDVFTYKGIVYETAKGDLLSKSLIQKGETIYDVAEHSPEYSYTLTPSVLSLIREHNDGYPYGYSTMDLVPYGIINKRTPIDYKVTSIEGKAKDEVLTFGHYGSKFLEEKLESFVTEKYKDKVLTKRKAQGAATVCSVKAGTDAASQAYELVQNSSCRWVDYVETTSDGKELRLSFK